MSVNVQDFDEIRASFIRDGFGFGNGSRHVDFLINADAPEAMVLTYYRAASRHRWAYDALTDLCGRARDGQFPWHPELIHFAFDVASGRLTRTKVRAKRGHPRENDNHTMAMVYAVQLLTTHQARSRAMAYGIVSGWLDDAPWEKASLSSEGVRARVEGLFRRSPTQ